MLQQQPSLKPLCLRKTELTAVASLSPFWSMGPELYSLREQLNGSLFRSYWMDGGGCKNSSLWVQYPWSLIGFNMNCDTNAPSAVYGIFLFIQNICFLRLRSWIRKFPFVCALLLLNIWCWHGGSHTEITRKEKLRWWFLQGRPLGKFSHCWND